MRIKGFALLGLCVILTALPACDNVEWGGVEMEVRVPERAPPPAEEGEEVAEEEARPLPLGPLVYLAERVDEETASLVPVALWAQGEYGDLPTLEDTPDLEERFPLGRWEAGTEFILLSRGGRAGTLLADGTVGWSEDRCLARPRTMGSLELRPGASEARAFLAIRREDAEAGAFGAGLPRSHLPDTGPVGDELRTAAEGLGRHLIPRTEIPWPPSIPGILQAWSVEAVSPEAPVLGATFVFGGELDPGPLAGSGYSFLALASRTEDGDWIPDWLWYQPAGAPRATPVLLGSGPLRDDGGSDLLLEVIGAEDRWLQLLADRGDGLRPIHRDPCGVDPASGTAAPWP